MPIHRRLAHVVQHDITSRTEEFPSRYMCCCWELLLFFSGVTLVDALGFRNFAMMELELILSCQSRPTNERLTLYLLLLPGEGHHS